MGIEVPTLQTALAIALASIPALLTVLWSIWQHNKRIEDVRDVLRSETVAKASELLASQREIGQRLETIGYRLGRIEEDVKGQSRVVEELRKLVSEASQNAKISEAEWRVDRERNRVLSELTQSLNEYLEDCLRRLRLVEEELRANLRKNAE